MRKLAAALMLWVSIAAPEAARPQDARFDAGDSRTVDIPFIDDNGHIFLEGRINGVGPVWMTLDTGAAGAVVDADRAAEFHVRATGQQRATGAGGTESIRTAPGITFALPGVSFPAQPAGLISLGFISQRTGRPVAAILGYDFFRAAVVDIDYSRQRIRLHEPRSYRYTGTGVIVPLEFDENLPYMQATLTMPAGGSADGRFVIDLGSNIPVIVSAASAKTHGLLRPADRTIEQRGRGVGGDVLMLLARAAGLEIQNVAVAGPIVAFPQSLGGGIAAEGAVGNVGAALLRGFRVIFDYSRRQMILERRAGFTESFEADMSGLALITSGARFEIVSIARVFAGTPAADVGLRPGDQVLEIDGRPAPDIGAIRRLFRQDGRQLTVGVSRNGEKKSFTLKLRRLV
jgi:Aspartyl protease/PDZ domain